MMLEPWARSIEQLASRYGAIVVGLAIGTAAKYGLQLSEGKQLTVKSLMVDALLLAMLGLIAILFADWFALQGNARVMCGALAAVSSDRLIRLARDRFERVAEQHMDRLLPEVRREAIINVPAGKGEPDTVAVGMPPADTPAARLAANLRAATPKAGPVPADHIEALRTLDQHP